MTTIAADLARASTLLQQGTVAEAERLLQGVMRREPGQPDALHLLGLLRRKTGDLAGALDLLQRSIAASPRRPEFHANLGNLLRALGRGAEAESAYRAALEITPGFRQARIGLVRLLNELERHQDAQAEARKLIERDAHDAEAWSALSDSLTGLNLREQAESAIRRAVELRPGYVVARHKLGVLLFTTQRAQEALREFDRAAADGLRGRELHFNRARALIELMRFDEAEAAFQSALGFDPLDPDTHRMLAQLRFTRGDIAFTRSVDEALARHPAHPRLSVMLANLLRQAGEFERSEAVIRGLLERTPSSSEALVTLALLYQQQNRFAESEAWARRSVEIRPDDVGIDTLVTALLALGRAAEALPMIERQRLRSPLDQTWLAHLATAARQLGRPEYGLLYDYERFVRGYTIEAPPGWSSLEAFHADLLPALIARHRFESHPLDQSLRHGSQTPRSLLAEQEPVIGALLDEFRRNVERYREAIGFDAGHPFLQRNRGDVQLVGCWSVRLRRGGYHVNHVHPNGWISSSYYAQVPAEVDDEVARSGWIKFGEPNVPTPGAPPAHFVQPRAGLLVLFPSYMWHGTTPITGDQPRITVPFDAAPVQSTPPAAPGR